MPKYYFRYDANWNYTDGSGCSNEVKTEAPMMSKYIVDSLKWWASEYKIKGFRFDLMGLIDTGTMAAASSSFYAEIMARIRKFPATSYLLAALVPLIPGAGVYYTMDFIRRGMGAEAWQKGMATAAIAGAVAVGVLLSSTAFRMWGVWKKSRLKKAGKRA